MREIKLYINGEFRNSSDNQTFDSLDPCNGEIVAKCHMPSTQDIENAVNSAEAAFYGKDWSETPQDKRADLLFSIAEKIKERKKELIEFEIKDSGSTVRKAKSDIHNTASFFKTMGKTIQKFSFTDIDANASREGFSKNSRIYQPVGVCAQIIPWNFPLLMAAWKIAPVLATGCTSVLKTAQETPVTAMILAEILHEAGLPKGVVNIITGGAKEGQALIKNPKIRKVAFTGSTEVGREILSQCASSIKNTTMELGGKSANIVLEDADLSIAVDGPLYAFLYHSGQACDSGTRLLVHEKIYPEFIEKFKKRAQDIKIGITSDPATGIGPVVSKKQLDRIENYINKTKEEGGKLLFGGNKLTSGEFAKGYFIEPTAFSISPDNTIFHEEIFGPVVGITVFAKDDEAIELANNSTYGLAGAVWGKDVNRCKNIAGKLEAGTVWINEYHLLNPGMPFGGWKQSGIGREMGTEGIHSYLEVKHLW
ncbi:MAG: aldehyde dehydrogenase family protein, partial [Halobacteriovoraceae bacterium]|nr:aldehyde dehydrogenase family protein [Halobacteriovoraceae bacterium]